VLGLALRSLVLCALALSGSAQDLQSREYALRMHDRLGGIPPDDSTRDELETLISAGDPEAAAQLAMQNPVF